MASFSKFDCFVEDLAEKVHNLGAKQTLYGIPVAFRDNVNEDAFVLER